MEQAYVHASFNTLTLFSVTLRTIHFVTMVNELAESKRLAFNGWYASDWDISPDDNLEELLATTWQRQHLTSNQLGQLQDIAEMPEAYNLDPERAARILKLWELTEEENYEVQEAPLEVNGW